MFTSVRDDARGQQSLPDTPAASRLADLMSVMSAATPAGVSEFVRDHYTAANAARLSLNTRIASFMDWKARGGMVVVDVTMSDPHRIEVTVCQSLSEERRVLSVEVESESPHRIETIMLGRSPLPTITPSLDDRSAADHFIAYTDRLARAGLFSGAVLLARNGRILAQQAWGLANRDFGVPNTLETRINVGSLNKMWTAIALAQLVEAHEVSFTDPLSKYINYPNATSAASIRLQHLLSHTSGLQSYFTDEFDRSARNALRTVDDFLMLSQRQPLAFEPGTDWRYSNTGMLVAGKVVEIVSGQTYFDYVHTHVLGHAGMDRSGFFELDRVNENLAVGYAKRWSPDGCEIVNNIFEHVVRGGPAGGGYSTVADMFRFTEALSNGTLLSTAMAEVLTTPKPELGSPLYGYGFTIHPERALYGHDGRFTGISANLDIVTSPPGWVAVVLANDNGMRAPALKARQLIGVTVPESTATQALATARARPR